MFDEDSCPACGAHCWEDGCCDVAKEAGIEAAVRRIIAGEPNGPAEMLAACERLRELARESS